MTLAVKPHISVANAKFGLHFISNRLSFVSVAKVLDFNFRQRKFPTETQW